MAWKGHLEFRALDRRDYGAQKLSEREGKISLDGDPDHEQRIAEQTARIAAGEERNDYSGLTREQKLDLPLGSSGLTLITVNALEDAYDVLYVRDLVRLSLAQLWAIPNFGPRRIGQVVDLIDQLGLECPWGPRK